MIGDWCVTGNSPSRTNHQSPASFPRLLFLRLRLVLADDLLLHLRGHGLVVAQFHHE